MKVRVLPLQPHCFAFGGFEVQMLSAISAAQECGVDVQGQDVWSRESDFDILHVWGLDIAQKNAISWAKKAGKRIVVTALLPYISIPHRFYYFGSAIAGVVRMKKQLLDMVDTLVVVNELQALSAQVLLGCDKTKIRIIPNIIEPQYFASNIENLSPVTSLTDYVLCTGNVCNRKNQINLAHAAISGGYPLLIIGDVLQGEEQYGAALQQVINGHENIRWVKGVSSGSPGLVSAYSKCAAFALPSFSEQQPISALEAAAAGKPLLLGNRAYAKQKYYSNAYLVDPKSVSSIRCGLDRVMSHPAQFVPEQSFLFECTRARVGAAYRDVYLNLMSSGSSVIV